MANSLDERIHDVLAKGAVAGSNVIMSKTHSWTKPGPSGAFRAAGLSLLRDMFGTSHQYYKDFDQLTTGNAPSYFQRANAIIEVVKEQVAHGWLAQTRGLIAAELFDDFLDMASHLLDEGYKDAAAVIAGSALESHLKRLCEAASIDLKLPDGKPKKADLINAELAKANTYDKNEQKQVTAWLGLRNDAAHGDYSKVDRGMVSLMIQGLRQFTSRHPA